MNHDIIRTLTLIELQRAKHRTRWLPPDEEGDIDLELARVAGILEHDPGDGAHLDAAADVLLKIHRAHRQGSRPGRGAG